MLPGLEMMACPEMAVSMDVMQHVINVESSRNPYAIGVVGGALGDVASHERRPQAVGRVEIGLCPFQAGRPSAPVGARHRVAE